MSNIWAVCKKEIKSYFTSPIAYVAIAVFLVLVGFFFQNIILWFNQYSMQMAQQMGQNPYYFQQININQMVFVPLFHNISLIFYQTHQAKLARVAEENTGAVIQIDYRPRILRRLDGIPPENERACHLQVDEQ